MTLNSAGSIADMRGLYAERGIAPMFEPWTIADVERLLAAARAMPGDVGGAQGRHRVGIPAADWWTALVLVLLDVPAKAGAVLDLEWSAYDRTRGTLAIPPYRYGLNALSVEALEAIRRPRRERLFPWPLEPAMRFHRFRELLFRAGLPHVRANLFERLRATARAFPHVLERIDPHLDVAVRPRAPRIPRGERADVAARSRDRARAEARRAEHAVYTIAHACETTLRNVLRSEYEPRTRIQPQSAAKFVAAINRLEAFLGCEATLEQLSDELLERFAAWALRTRRPPTVASYLRHLRALWRFAWRRHLVDEGPRENATPRAERRLPVCWSTEEMGRLLDAAAQAPGFIGIAPADDWWLAFLSVLYETGLRVAAALALEASALDRETGWLSVPAAVQKHRADQVFRLSAETVALVRRLPATARLFPPLPWGTPNLAPLRRRFRRILEAAGLPAGRRDQFHKIRRTHATYVADAFDEHEAQRQLGHSSLQVTRSYIDGTKLRKRVHAADALPRPPRRQTEVATP